MAANTQRSSTKRSTNARAKPKKSATRKPAKSASRSTSSRSRASSNGRSTTTRSSKPSTSRSTASRSSSNNNGNGVVDTVKSAAGKAAAPAAAVGAAALGIAGGIALKSRTRRKTVLGVKMPRSFSKSLPDLDAKSIAKSVGHASKQFAKTSRGVSKDLERAGDQAERIGKILD
jgi:DNA-binding protein HU-beta